VTIRLSLEAGHRYGIDGPDDRGRRDKPVEDRRASRSDRIILPGTAEQTQDFAIFTPRRSLFRFPFRHKPDR